MTESSHKSSSHVDEAALQEIKLYIDALVRNMAPLHFSYDDREELAQRSWIKYWQITQKKEIHYPKGYVRFIVHSMLVTMIRQRKPLVVLTIPEDGEIDSDQEKVMVEISEGMANPELVVEQAIEVAERMTEVIEALANLSARQRRAMACTLWEKLDDLVPYVDALSAREMDLDLTWPADPVEKQRLQASCAPARRNVARSMHIEMHGYKRWMDG